MNHLGHLDTAVSNLSVTWDFGKFVIHKSSSIWCILAVTSAARLRDFGRYPWCTTASAILPLTRNLVNLFTYEWADLDMSPQE